MKIRMDSRTPIFQRYSVFLAMIFGVVLGFTACGDNGSDGAGAWDIHTGVLDEPDSGPLPPPREDAGPDSEPFVSRCIELRPDDTVDFGTSTIGQMVQNTVVIKNCSPNESLTIQQIAIADDAGGVFEIRRSDLPDGLPDDALTLAAREQASFVVRFIPRAERDYRGRVRVQSNDRSQPGIELELTGQGTNNACPTASALAYIVGNSDSEPGTNLIAEPLDTVQFDAGASAAPEGSISRYEWTILSSPTASSERLEPADSEAPTLFLDANGEYRVELKVYDEQGTVSCGQPAIITILASADEDIHIQLTWATVGSTMDNDVDLHYSHPNSNNRWGDQANGWDCYYGNQTPNWLVTNGSPVLDIDDLEGPGPENISHSNLEAVTYRVAVHYFGDHGNGPAYATVEIRNGGVLIYSSSDKRLTDNQFWLVGELDGRDRTVNPIDTVSNLGIP